MHYGKLLLVTLITTVLTGCAVTNPSPQPRASDAPPLVKSGYSEAASTDIKAEYSTASSDGMMTGASISIAPQASGSSVPRIPNASETNTSVGAQTAIPQQQITTSQNLAGGFSVNMPYQKAWTSTEKALPSAGYPVMEKDDLTGTYYVLDKASSAGKVQRDTPIYQVRLTKSGENATHIILLNATSQPAPAAVSNRILSALKSKLS